MLCDVFVCLFFFLPGVCELLSDDACWIMCVIVFMNLCNMFVCSGCGLVCHVVWCVVVCVVVLCVCESLFFKCV